MPDQVRVVRSSSVGERDFARIQDFRSEYYGQVFEGVEPYKVSQFVGRTLIDSWRNPNRAVGTKTMRAGQSFARSRTATITGDNGLRAVTQFNDNASSVRSQPLASLERFAKLRVPHPTLITHRFRAVRELLAFSGDDAARLLEVAYGDVDPRQPQTAYVFSAEDLVIDVLKDAGFGEDEAFSLEQRADPEFPGTDDHQAIYMQKYVR